MLRSKSFETYPFWWIFSIHSLNGTEREHNSKNEKKWTSKKIYVLRTITQMNENHRSLYDAILQNGIYYYNTQANFCSATNGTMHCIPSSTGPMYVCVCLYRQWQRHRHHRAVFLNNSTQKVWKQIARPNRHNPAITLSIQTSLWWIVAIFKVTPCQYICES